MLNSQIDCDKESKKMKNGKNKGLYLNILRNAEYRKLLFSNLINRFGDSVEAIAFTWIVYQITHSAAWSAVVFALNMLPNVLVQPFAGALIEKLNKKKVVIATHFLRAALISLFIVLYKFDCVSPAVLAVFTLMITTVESFNLPADTAFTAQVVKREDVSAGMSLNSVFTHAASLVGSGVAGFIIAGLGVEAAMFTDISTFLVAAILIGLIKKTGEITAQETSSEKGEAPGYAKLFKDGIAYVFKTPVVRNFCVLCIVLNLMLIPINALQAPIADGIFGMGSELLSFAGIFASLGGIAGAALLPYISKALSPLKITILGTAMLTVGMACVPCGRLVRGNAFLSYMLISFCFFIMVASASLVGGIINIQFMKCVDRSFMARASAVFGASATAAMPVGSLITGMLVSHISVTYLLIGSAVFSAVILVMLMIMQPVLENKEGSSDAAQPE